MRSWLGIPPSDAMKGEIIRKYLQDKPEKRKELEAYYADPNGEFPFTVIDGKVFERE